MSDPETPRRPGATGKQRKTQFEIREEMRPRPPRPIDRSRDPFEDVEVAPRTARTTKSLVTARPQPKTPAISRAPVAPGVEDEPRRRPPQQRGRTESELAALLDIPPRRAAPPPYRGPLPDGRGVPLWLLGLVCAACLVVIYLWLQPAETRFSAFPGGREGAPAAVEVDPLSYPRLPTPPGQTSVIGPPTIDAAMIEAILARYGSPAVGTGRVWIEMGVKYKIDPAFAVAFFIHESGAGTAGGWAGLKPDGTTTHNVGNIICAGYPTCFGRFRDYPSWETGIEDWYKLIAVEYIDGRGAHTIEQIIPIYAPSVENNVPLYVNTVNGLVNDWRRGVVR